MAEVHGNRKRGPDVGFDRFGSVSIGKTPGSAVELVPEDRSLSVSVGLSGSRAVSDEVGARLDQARDRWGRGQDRRALRQALLAILVRLDDAEGG